MANVIRGLGRPPEFVNPVKTTIIFERSDLQLFKEIALRQGDSVSELIRPWARKYVEEHQHNDQATLDLSIGDSTFKAFPTVWDSTTFSIERLKEYCPTDISEMKSKLEEGLSNSIPLLIWPEESPRRKARPKNLIFCGS